MGTIIRSQAWFASWDGTMTTQEDWRLRNVIRSVTFISGDSSFPWYFGVSHRCNNLRRKGIKEESTKPTTSAREFTSNNIVHEKSLFFGATRNSGSGAPENYSTLPEFPLTSKYSSRSPVIKWPGRMLTVCFLVIVPSDVARLWISLRSSMGGEAINTTNGMNSGVFRIFRA